MQTFHLPSGREFQRPHTCEATFWGYQALLSQLVIGCDDRLGADEDTAEARQTAVDEWSRAVRAGFICC